MQRTCNFCGSELVKKGYESSRDFNRRKFCGRQCCWDSLRKSDEHKKAVKAKCDREYYLNNKEKISRYYCKWSKDNGYKIQKRWKRNNKGSVVESRTRRKAYARNATINDFTKDQWIEVLDALGHECFYCGKSDVKLSQDHVIPLFRGGDNTKMNIVPACISCNSSKGYKLISEWRAL